MTPAKPGVCQIHGCGKPAYPHRTALPGTGILAELCADCRRGFVEGMNAATPKGGTDAKRTRR